jgi:hypothetical protein
MFEHTPKLTGSYLKNASAKKDEGGDYWLYIASSEGQAMFCLSECVDLDAIENAGIRRTLDAWLAEQDATDRDSNGNF